MTDWEEWNPNEDVIINPPIEASNADGTDKSMLSWSTLSRFLKEPLYFMRNREWKIESKGLDLGSYIHRMLLQPDEYAKKYKTFTPPCNPTTGEPYKSGKKYQDALTEFQKEFLAIPERGEETLTEIKANLNDYDLMKYLQGMNEVLLTGECSGVKIKGFIDSYSTEYGLVDLKTTSSQLHSLDADYFRYKIREYSYVYQLAFYAILVHCQTGVYPQCRIVAVQTTVPFQVGLYEISPIILEKAIEQIQEDYLPMWNSYQTCGHVNKFFCREIDSL